ncbi:hypothetical protein [Arenibacter sp. ARW7G5Y1]|uniref:hypothetical protein n=1 Tax=Arenibacter sp. ARW7G5Y1 TaxID=2135619 RepID=UPI000D8E967B|nr:hypothetical protein [Arenibacter sp. ARW7G5Y1]PXX21661.1 D-isomer specific 2-hydroxyacid dehydrogenase-like protein [Arenibacter sp. ARW7G5Y1]
MKELILFAIIHEFDLMPREEVLKIVDKLSVIINQGELLVDNDLLEKGKLLRIVSSVAIGYDNLNVELMSKYGV